MRITAQARWGFDMRHVNVKLDDADWAAFERLRTALSKRRKKALTMSTMLRLVVRAGIEANEAVIKKVADTPIKPPPAPQAQWEAFVGKAARAAAADAATAKDLYAKFDMRCGRSRISPHRFYDEALKIDPRLDRPSLHKWFYRGELPVEPVKRACLADVVEKWLEDAND
jgi:hypothetical protein